MDILEHAMNGGTRLHVIVGDCITQVKSPSALTPMLLVPGHNSDVGPSQQQMLVDYMLGS